jgi:hypothetical protein
MTNESAPQKWGASEMIFTATEKNQSQTNTASVRVTLAQARAHHLAVVTVATANGTLEPTPQLLNATAALATSLAFDLFVAAA